LHDVPSPWLHDVPSPQVAAVAAEGNGPGPPSGPAGTWPLPARSATPGPSRSGMGCGGVSRQPSWSFDVDDTPGDVPAVIGASQFVRVDGAGDGAALQQAQTLGSDPNLVARAFRHDDVRRVMRFRVPGAALRTAAIASSPTTGSKPKTLPSHVASSVRHSPRRSSSSASSATTLAGHPGEAVVSPGDHRGNHRGAPSRGPAPPPIPAPQSPVEGSYADRLGAP
jgi:hypothetical protein